MSVVVEAVVQIVAEWHLAVAEVLLQPTACVVRALPRRIQFQLEVRPNGIHRSQMVQLVGGISQQQTTHRWNHPGRTSRQMWHVHHQSKRSSHPRSLMVFVAGLVFSASLLLPQPNPSHLAQSRVMMPTLSHQLRQHRFPMTRVCLGYRLL